MKVLVVDDDRATVRLLERAVNSWGFETVTALDGNQALEALRADSSIHIALIDWMMPDGISGIDVLKHLQQRPVLQPTYIVLVTSHTEKSFIVQALDAGADDFISKPFDLEVLKSRVKVAQRNIESQLDLRVLNEKLDEEVKARTQELQEALQLAENASNMKSHFLANMSHEIRTPLNGIVSYVELLLSSELTEEQREDLLTIRSSTHSLRTIINDVLDFSKIEAGKMLVEHIPYDFRQASQEVFDILLREAEERGIEVIINFDDKIPRYMVGDRVRWQQILTNLLSNAFKFSPKDRAVVFQAVVVNDSSTGEQKVHATVTDTGIGIPADKLNQIFESFVQVDSTTTRKYGGTGLGLAIVKKLTELLGGTIWVSSREGIGTTFHVLLPLVVDHSGHEKVQAVTGEIELKLLGAKILIAEDNEANQKSLHRLLEKVGCIVTATSDGNELLAKAQQQTYDLLLVDIQMPQVGGEEACRIIRTGSGPNKHTPIIALTANIIMHEKERYLSAGIQEIIGKPIDFNQLFTSISRLIKDRRNKNKL